jgi:hypothetical protein
VVATSIAAVAIASSATAKFRVSDQFVYARLFRDLGLLDSPQQAGTDTDFLFVWAIWALGHVVPTHPALLFGAVATALATAYLFACYRILSPWAALAAWMTLIASGWFASYSVVAIRQGLAIACLMAAVAIVVTSDGSRVLLYSLLLLAPLFHWSATIPALLAALVSLRDVSVRLVALTWCGLAIAFLLDVQQRLFGRFEQELPRMAEYLAPGSFRSYEAGGNRLDFLLVSAAFVAIGLLGRRLLGRDKTLDRLLVILVTFNCYYLAFGFVAFSDRIAAYSWFIAPLLTWYVLSRTRNVALSTVIIAGIVCYCLAGGALAGPLAT